MAYGFNDDKSKAQVLTAGEIKRKYINLPVNSTSILEPGVNVEVSIDVSAVIDVNKIIGIIGIQAFFSQGQIILVGIAPTFDLGKIKLNIQNVGSAPSKYSGSVGLYVTYIDQ